MDFYSLVVFAAGLFSIVYALSRIEDRLAEIRDELRKRA